MHMAYRKHAGVIALSSMPTMHVLLSYWWRRNSGRSDRFIVHVMGPKGEL